MFIYLPAVFGKDCRLRFRRCRSSPGETFACFKKGFSISVQYIWQMFFFLLVNNILMRRSGESGAAVLFVLAFPELICRFFGLEADITGTLGVHALRVYGVSLLFAGTSVILQGYCQACGEGKRTFLLTTLRGAAVLIPCTLLFSMADIRYFWLIFPVTEIVSLVLFLLTRRFLPESGDCDPARICARTISSRNEDLGELLGEIGRFGAVWGADPKQIYFVNMAVEEICMAIMQNGFSGGGEGYIQVTLIADTNGEFELHIRDNAEKFNPFSMDTVTAAQEDSDPDAMGIMVIKRKSKSFYYRQFQGFNTMVFTI